MKKRQQDFHKTKVKVGRKLPKGLNVTDTSFKSKKIVKPDQLKKPAQEKNLDDLMKLLEHKKTRDKTLSQIANYIPENLNELAMKFSKFLQVISTHLLDNEPKVRTSAVNVFNTCLKLSPKSRVNCFSKEIGLYLKCMMTGHIAIQEDSFNLLDSLLKHHPTVVVQSIGLLKALLNMISYEPESGKNESKKKRKLSELISNTTMSQDWRINVLSRMRSFVRILLSVSEQEENTVEVLQVYVDGTRQVHAPIYTGGGARPAPLETSKPSVDILHEHFSNFHEFVSEVVPLLSEILKGEKINKGHKDTSDNIFEYGVISTLSVVSQVLCCIGDWFQKVRPDQKDQSIIDAIRAIVCNQLLPCFPYLQHSAKKKKQAVKDEKFSCANLNLNICYLYSIFVLRTEYNSPDKQSKILPYLAETYRISGSLEKDSMDLTLKTSKYILLSPGVEESVIDGMLLGLLGFLDVYRFTEIGDFIYSLFSDLSLDYDHRHLLKSEGMKMWFQIIFKELDFMYQAKVANKEFIWYVAKMAAVKHEPFADFLNNKVDPEALAEMLKHTDEDFQWMIIQLVNGLDRIQSSFFEAACKIIRDVSFSMKNVSRLLHLYHVRFSDPSRSDSEKLVFVKFLMNVACDSPAITNPPSEDEKQLLPDAVRRVTELCQVEIFPPRHLDRSLQLTELCLELLENYFTKHVFVRCAVLFEKSLLVTYSRYPLQCALAMLSLRKTTRIYHESYPDQQLEELYGELFFTCYIYMSVIIFEKDEDTIKACGVRELEKGLDLKEMDIMSMIHVIGRNYSDLGHNELFHVLKVLVYLINKRLLNMNNGPCCDLLLRKLGEECQMSETLRPVFYHVANSLGFFERH